jgi:multiple sugar transport system ATP-binding protein
MAEVEINAVSKAFGKTQALSDLSLTIGDGEFVALLGPTGAGKTTALRLIAGLEQPDGGSIRIDGRDVTGDAPADRDVAFVFQQYSLYPHLTVFENMAFALRAPTRRVPEADIRAKVQEVARLLHIETKLDNKATQLSGGQMQRVAIARALIADPKILVADEPTGNLDSVTGQSIIDLFRRLATEQGLAILLTTHNPTFGHAADRVITLQDGRIVSAVTADIEIAPVIA